MGRRDNCRERFEAVEPWTDPVRSQTRMGTRRRRGGWGLAGGWLALWLALGLLLLPAAAVAQQVGKGSCVPENACAGNTGPIGTNACVGDFAC